LPDIETIWQQHGGTGDLLVYGLHSGETPQKLADFIEQTGITFPVLHSNGTLGRFSYPPGVGYPYPRDVVIGKDLTIRSIKASFDAGEMEALVEALLAE